MPPVGRPLLSRAVFDLAGFPPEVVVLDTSAVVEALLDDQPQHEEYAGFLERAVEAGCTLAYCGGLLDLELAETSVTIALKRLHRGRWFAHRHDGRALRPARVVMTEVFRRWRRMIESTRSARVPLDDVHEQAVALMRRYAVSSNDAAHAATAQLLVAPLLCRDVHFARIPRLALFTDSTRLAECRRLRTRRT